MIRRIRLAFVAFFRVLLGRPLPAGLPVEGAPAALPAPSASAEGAACERGAVSVLAMLQRDGRLIDFLEEDIDAYEDERVGAAARQVHRGCRRSLHEHFDLEPVMAREEGAEVEVEQGFDAVAIRLTGAVAGEPPFRGVLKHHGWRVRKATLPSAQDGIVAPAEVEL